jgi:hypothetical protein
MEKSQLVQDAREDERTTAYTGYHAGGSTLV